MLYFTKFKVLQLLQAIRTVGFSLLHSSFFLFLSAEPSRFPENALCNYLCPIFTCQIKYLKTKFKQVFLFSMEGSSFGFIEISRPDLQSVTTHCNNQLPKETCGKLHVHFTSLAVSKRMLNFEPTRPLLSGSYQIMFRVLDSLRCVILVCFCK